MSVPAADRDRWRPAAAMFLLLGLGPLPAAAQQESVLDTRHNLSVSGPGEVRAVDESQVCKFCHIPHNAIQPVPLWGHEFSKAQYDVPEIHTETGREPAPQPDGSSRLCLSCHDGTVALGEIAGEPQPIRMAGSERLAAGRRGFLGTDLSGSHPISFVVPDSDPTLGSDEQDMTLQPLAVIQADPDVRLDGSGKMQCTTCHDPHSDRFYVPDRTPHFWVKGSLEEVRLTCHAVR